MKKLTENRFFRILFIVVLILLTLLSKGWIDNYEKNPKLAWTGVSITLFYYGFLGYLFWPSKETVERFLKFLKE